MTATDVMGWVVTIFIWVLAAFGGGLLLTMAISVIMRVREEDEEE